MKEQIYTIPVNDGFNEDSECAFCSMYEKLEKDALGYTLGPSYMEQDVRDMTNEKGFCKAHYEMMYKAQNRLGLALMVSTHMAKLEEEMTVYLKNAMKEKKSVFGKGKKDRAESLAEKLEGSCFVCDKIEQSMERYFDTFFYLWKRDGEFRDKVMASKGFCAKHFLRLIDMSEKKLGGDARNEFLAALEKLNSEHFNRVREELLWFISKFDYRFKDRPWGNSRDSLRRAIIKTASFDAEKE